MASLLLPSHASSVGCHRPRNSGMCPIPSGCFWRRNSPWLHQQRNITAPAERQASVVPAAQLPAGNQPAAAAADTTRNRSAPSQTDNTTEIDADRKIMIGEKKMKDWMTTSGITPAPVMSLDELKNANVSWQDTYKSKRKTYKKSGRKPVKAKKPDDSTEQPAAGPKPRGFGGRSDLSTVKVFRYGVEKTVLQHLITEAGLSGRVVQVERVEDADAIIAIKLTRKGEHIGLQQAERTATNAGIPLVVAGRRLSTDSLLRALKPLLDKLPASTSSPSQSLVMDQTDDWDSLEPAAEFEDWDQDDLENEMIDDQPKPKPLFKPKGNSQNGVKLQNGVKSQNGVKTQNAAKGKERPSGKIGSGGTIQAGAIKFGRATSRPRKAR